VYSQRTILDLVDHIYDAVEDEALWPTFLDTFAHVLRAQVGTLYIHDLRTQKGGTELVTGMDPAYNKDYRAYYASRNVYMTQGKALLVAGNVMTSEELCPDEKVLPSEFYNEWVRPQALRRGLNGVLFNEGSLAGSIGAIRARAVRPFCVDDKRFLRALIPHLQRAVRLRRRIADLEVHFFGERISGYMSFHNFRETWTQLLGFDLEDMQGFGGTRPWTNEPLQCFLSHSDCEGEISWQDAEQILARAREDAPKLPDLNWAFSVLIRACEAAVAHKLPISFC